MSGSRVTKAQLVTELAHAQADLQKALDREAALVERLCNREKELEDRAVKLQAQLDESYSADEYDEVERGRDAALTALADALKALADAEELLRALGLSERDVALAAGNPSMLRELGRLS